MNNTNKHSEHLAAIIPVACPQLDFNMPWQDCLMPIHHDYHAVERAVYLAAVAGCNTIWLVMHRETQPIIKKKVGEWIHDPETTWIFPKPFWNKKEIPIYYVSIKPRDRRRRDSNAWSCLYGAKISSYVSRKISKWVVPKRYLVIPPYGVIDEVVIKNSRKILRGKNNVLFKHNDKTFLDNSYLPFTFDEPVYDEAMKNFREIYTGNDVNRTYKDIFGTVDISNYLHIEANWHYKIDNWNDYRLFLGSKENEQCKKPKILVSHKWRGFVDNIPKVK